MCRAFEDRDVPEEKVESILDAARRFPSAGHTQPQEFIVVRDPGVKEALGRAALDQMFLADAPVLIAVVSDTDRSAARYRRRGVEFYSILDGGFASMLVLLAAVELCSLHFHYGSDPEAIVANALFADGAGAAVLGATDRDGGRDAGDLRLLGTGSFVFPDSKDAMSWKIGDHGFEMTLSRNVPALISRHLRPWIESWLDRQDLSMAKVASWAVHPGGPRILEAVEDALELAPHVLDVSRMVFERYGNMSSPTVLFILDRLMARRAPRPCVALGFGPGLAVEAALFV